MPTTMEKARSLMHRAINEIDDLSEEDKAAVREHFGPLSELPDLPIVISNLIRLAVEAEDSAVRLEQLSFESSKQVDWLLEILTEVVNESGYWHENRPGIKTFVEKMFGAGLEPGV